MSQHDDPVKRLELLKAAEPLDLMADAERAMSLARYGVLSAEATDSMVRLAELAKMVAEYRCRSDRDVYFAFAELWS